MWTMAGMVSFVCYGLTRFAVDPINAWRVRVRIEKKMMIRID